MKTCDGLRMYGYSIMITIAFYARAIVQHSLAQKTCCFEFLEVHVRPQCRGCLSPVYGWDIYVPLKFTC